ncbi:MAG: hypothetical protein HYY06_09490 [Deltaproteobacteria bacterium]|nr:hypothetical protein [Deltaproteobacteria bacterium]
MNRRRTANGYGTDPWPQPVPACCDSQCPADTPAYDEDNCGGCVCQGI